MIKRLQFFVIMSIGFAGLSALVGFSYGVGASSYIAAEALEESIHGAESPDEVRSRIADYYSSTTVNRLVLFVTPGIAAAICSALALFELTKERGRAETGPSTTHGRRAESPSA